MKPLFDSACRHVGWMSHRDVFDKNMNWLAYIKSGELFSAVDMSWLGPVIPQVCLCDQHGHVVAFTGHGEPRAVWRPVRPSKRVHNGYPKRPVKPSDPAAPAVCPEAQWSTMSFGLWVGG